MFHRINKDIFYEICKYLSKSDIVNLLMTSKNIYQLVFLSNSLLVNPKIFFLFNLIDNINLKNKNIIFHVTKQNHFTQIPNIRCIHIFNKYMSKNLIILPKTVYFLKLNCDLNIIRKLKYNTNIKTMQIDNNLITEKNYYLLTKLINLKKIIFGYSFNRNIGSVFIDYDYISFNKNIGSVFIDYDGNIDNISIDYDYISFDCIDFYKKQPPKIMHQYISYLPNQLEKIFFGYSFNKEIGYYPHISFGTIYDRCPICYSNNASNIGSYLPQNLKKIIFGYCFHKPIASYHYNCFYKHSVIFLPSTLKYLKFGYSFNQIIGVDHTNNKSEKFLPENLEILEFGYNFNKKIGGGESFLPNNLIELKFGPHFSRAIQYSQYKCSTDSWERKSYLPSSLEKLTICINYKNHISIFPKNIKIINFINENNKVIETINFKSN